MVQILCTKVQKLEILTKTQRLALSCGHVTMGPAHRDGCPARRLYITLVNGVMRGGLYVCRLARPNCNTLTLSFYILTESEPHPRPPPHAPTAFFTQSFCKNSVQYQRLLVQYQLYREPPIFKPIDRRQGRERLESCV